MALASTAKLTKPKQEFDPTPEQQAAIKMCLNGRDMKLIAFAGAGKTSTLVLLAKELNKQGKTGLYLAFNKAIADEAAKKMPNNVVSKTFHSLAYANAPNHIKSRLQKDCPSWEFQKIFRLVPFSVRVRETEIDYQAILRGDVEDDADNPPKRLVSVKIVWCDVAAMSFGHSIPTRHVASLTAVHGEPRETRFADSSRASAARADRPAAGPQWRETHEAL